MTRAAQFEAVRPLLFALARRVLGSADQARDAVETARLRWAGTAARPASVEGHLAAEVVAICTGVLSTARLRQQAHHGPWPAGPLPGGGQDDSQDDGARAGAPAQLAESLLTAALLVLERLSPLQRAVFVLREAFGCGTDQIAAALGCSAEAAGQVVAAVAAASDGDGEPPPWPAHVTGARNVARLLTAVVPPLAGIGVELEEHRFSGRPGSLLRDRAGQLLGGIALDVRDDRVEGVHLVLPGTPDTPADPVAEAQAILREANRAR
ncbi:sigma factor-like helix-turn-helix DNA-binding protein [Streptomyces sp. NPDC006997]|uniref:sigma factor-like helix-turn-helix DNA-binding protein n=1 Tax=Streptomyces sp. NPDC006997 TaxID=3155356 RepID=UPI0033DCDF13